MTVSQGSTYTIDATTADDGMDCARISDTQMLSAYRDSNTVLGARVLGINTTTKVITVNAQSDITHPSSATSMKSITLARFSATKFLATFFNSSTRTLTAQVLNVSGTTTSGATIKTLTDDPSQGSVRVQPLTSTTALLSYNEFASGDTYTRVLSIDGSDNITESGRVILVGWAVSELATVDLFTPTLGLCAFQDASDNDYLKCQVFTISGTTVAKSGGVQNINTTNLGGDFAVAIAPVTATTMVVGYDEITTAEFILSHVTVAGSTISAGTAISLGTEHNYPTNGVATNDETVLMAGNGSGRPLSTWLRVNQVIISGTNLTYTPGDRASVNSADYLTLDSIKVIEDDFALALNRGSVQGTIIGSDAAAISVSHIWLSTDGGATYSNIGDSATWTTDLVGGVVVVPGTAYGTIFAAVGTNLYKTVNGGTAWTLETAVGYEVDFIDLEKDNTTVFLAKRDAAGTNRASLWDSVGASLTHINTGKTTTGGATSGGDVV